MPRSWHRQRLKAAYEEDPEGLKQRWWRGGGRRHGGGRGEGRVHADGTYTGAPSAAGTVNQGIDLSVFAIAAVVVSVSDAAYMYGVQTVACTR